MTASARIPLPYNPEVLCWARERRGITMEAAARKAKVSEAKFAEWESTGGSKPTVRQGRVLAACYGRHFPEFSSKSIPVVPDVKLVPDFRSYSGRGNTDHEVRALKAVQECAESFRENALSLIDEIGEQPPAFSGNLRFSVEDDVDVAASVIREAMNFPFERQRNLKPPEKHRLPDILRGKIERIGVLVLRQNRIAKLNTRGMCLFVTPLPVIVYGNESASAQAFTLMHEFGHVLLGESGISGPPGFGNSRIMGKKAVENWCNRFSAAFLAPADEFAKVLNVPKAPMAGFDLNTLSDLAKNFSISLHAMLIRLVNLNYVRPDFYWRKMRPVFIREKTEHKSFGRSPCYGKRYVNRWGKFYTGLVLEAWGSGKISAHNASEYMEIKKFEHLRDIRENLRA